MALVDMREMLKDAKKRKYAIGSFDVSNNEMVCAVVEVAEELQAPIILAAIPPDLERVGVDELAALTTLAAKKATVPICVLLDHAGDMNLIRDAIAGGFTSVMFDGSRLTFSENVRQTQKVCEYAHARNVSVEAELGHVSYTAGCREDGQPTESQGTSETSTDPKDLLTDPQEVVEFVEKTGVDALAVAIGTIHGIYTKKPEIDFERLKVIRDAVPEVPLVLHGGSGTPDEDIKKVIALGICKINIFSEVVEAFFTSLKAQLNSLEKMSTWPHIVFKEPVKAMREIIRKKIVLFGSDRKA